MHLILVYGYFEDCAHGGGIKLHTVSISARDEFLSYKINNPTEIIPAKRQDFQILYAIEIVSLKQEGICIYFSVMKNMIPKLQTRDSVFTSSWKNENLSLVTPSSAWRMQA